MNSQTTIKFGGQTNRWFHLSSAALIASLVLIIFSSFVGAQDVDATQTDLRLISDTEPDLVIPELSTGELDAGKRIKQTHPDYAETDVYHVIYLPTDWEATKKYPVIFEYAGNGNFENRLGDISTGLVEDSKLGFGITEGQGFIWVCLPYLNNLGNANVIEWWGDRPDFNPQPTIDYCLKTVPWVCEKYSGDSERVVIAGFSRGSIACNYIGLHNDEISKLWCAFIPYSHYDGVRRWKFPESDFESAKARLKRLGNRPQFICSESKQQLAETEDYLKQTSLAVKASIVQTGFRNHNDSWVLRPGTARTQLREWLETVVQINLAPR